MSFKKFLLSSIISLSIVAPSLAADKFEIDPSHSSVAFSVKHLVVTNARGNFKDFAGTILYDDKDIQKSSVDVKIKSASIDTDNTERDKHLKGPDFFDTEKYPELTFKSNKVIKKAKGYVLNGTLTLHGVSKEVNIPFELNGLVKDPWGGTRLGAHGETTINRKDYGLIWNKNLDNGGLAVGDEVKITLDIEAIKK